jgi:hypothetical protein
MLKHFYTECIAEFGFEHIIVIGEMDYGLLFLDCYGNGPVFMTIEDLIRGERVKIEI